MNPKHVGMSCPNASKGLPNAAGRASECVLFSYRVHLLSSHAFFSTAPARPADGATAACRCTTAQSQPCIRWATVAMYCPYPLGFMPCRSCKYLGTDLWTAGYYEHLDCYHTFATRKCTKLPFAIPHAAQGPNHYLTTRWK